MKVKEIFDSENGIFANIFKPNFPVLYTTIFGEDDPVLIDIQARTKYGEKNLISAITKETATEIVKAIVTVKFDEWQKQIQVFNKDYDVLDPVTSKEVSNESYTSDETGSNNTVDSKTAFNDGNFNNESKQARDTTGNRQSTTKKESTKSGISGSIPVSEVIQKEIALRKQNFKVSVIAELISEITVDIY